MPEILFVDDDEKIRDIFGRLLDARGYHVRTARDGQEAVEVVHQQSFDLIIMDVKMPRLDGCAAYRHIHELLPETPVVLMTGYGVRDELDALVKQGAVAYLHKPVLMKDLESTVNRLLHLESP